ncbi:MAG TPA: type II toxin-antitoxin system HicB family antitoxin [Phycisphaerae bacterium]|nr:type II toxin-antitoxin system HicB family antitoxin [Phycisphaerae bacterium]
MKLTIRIFDDERGGYIAICPSLPGCRCRGGSREEARQRLEEAVRGYIAAVSNCVPENVSHDLLVEA